MGAESSSELDDDEDDELVSLAVLPMVEPYKIGIEGLIMDRRNLVDASGLSYNVDTGVRMSSWSWFTRLVGTYASARVVM